MIRIVPQTVRIEITIAGIRYVSERMLPEQAEALRAKTISTIFNALVNTGQFQYESVQNVR